MLYHRDPTVARALLFVLLLVLLAGCATAPPAPTPTPAPDIVAIMRDDMLLPHEAAPHGVPASYDWARGPRLGMGNDPGAFRAITAWGQVYIAADGNPARNTRVELRDLQVLMLDRSGNWQVLQSSTAVDGAAFREDFVDNINRPANIRPEPGGGVSVTAGDGYNFHFWPTTQRAAIDPADLVGIVTVVRARLVVDDPALPDDRASARYLLSVGADYWSDTAAEWDNFKTNGDVGIGRFRFVTREWQWFTMTSLGATTLRSNPPPLLPLPPE